MLTILIQECLLATMMYRPHIWVAIRRQKKKRRMESMKMVNFIDKFNNYFKENDSLWLMYDRNKTVCKIFLFKEIDINQG